MYRRQADHFVVVCRTQVNCFAAVVFRTQVNYFAVGCRTQVTYFAAVYQMQVNFVGHRMLVDFVAVVVVVGVHHQNWLWN